MYASLLLCRKSIDYLYQFFVYFDFYICSTRVHTSELIRGSILFALICDFCSNYAISVLMLRFRPYHTNVIKLIGLRFSDILIQNLFSANNLHRTLHTLKNILCFNANRTSSALVSVAEFLFPTYKFNYDKFLESNQ